jgi:hypothetical protein
VVGSCEVAGVEVEPDELSARSLDRGHELVDVRLIRHRLRELPPVLDRVEPRCLAAAGLARSSYARNRREQLAA